MKFLRHGILLPIFACLLASPGLHAAQADELLPIEQAFRVEAKALDHDTVQLDWKLAEHYYLYRDRIKVTTADAGLALGAHELPAGEKKHDEFLGDVEVYHKDFSSTQKLTAPAAAAQITLAVRYQGCHEVEPKICYPPHTVKLAVDLPAATAAALPTAGATNLLGGASGGALATGEPLPVDQAYVFEAIASGPGEVLVRFTMPKGYYLYRDKTSFRADNATLGAPRWPEGRLHEDVSFGKTTVYFDQVDVPISVSNLAAGQPLHFTSTFQGCLEGSVCYPAAHLVAEYHPATPK